MQTERIWRKIVDYAEILREEFRYAQPGGALLRYHEELERKNTQDQKACTDEKNKVS